jgi:hypothetical protein
MFQGSDVQIKIPNTTHKAQTAPLPQYQKTHTNQWVK